MTAASREGLGAVSVTAFVESATSLQLEAPRGYTSATGTPGRTGWILDIGGSGFPTITLHVKDPAKLWELHDLIAATLPPRTEAGASDA